jgi:hypothetical protein
MCVDLYLVKHCLKGLAFRFKRLIRIIKIQCPLQGTCSR